MAIPSKQIGWSQRAKLLWNISKQLENLIKVAGNVTLPTPSPETVTVYSQSIDIFPINYIALSTKCNGNDVGNVINTSYPAGDINELVTVLNNDVIEAKVLGTYSALGQDVLVLTTTPAIKNALCPTGELTLYVFNE
jgi:hypothetical protein